MVNHALNNQLANWKLLQDQANATLNTITFTMDVQQLKNMDLIVKAVIENIDLKLNLYQELGQTCQPATVFASNTSSLSITEMAHFSSCPQNFVGMHFFNPIQLMKLVKVICYWTYQSGCLWKGLSMGERDW